MKTLYFTIAITLFTALQTYAQRPKEIKNSEVKGIYLSFTDFRENRLTIPTDNQHDGDKIKLKQFFISPDILTIEQDKETVFYKDSIFAIQLSSGESYRFINRTPCLIADTSYLYIYTNKTFKTVFKQYGRLSRTEKIPVTQYYFTTGDYTPVYMLTLANIGKYVLRDAVVHKVVCDKFTSDDMLSEINQNTRRFVLNETIISLFNK